MRARASGTPLTGASGGREDGDTHPTAAPNRVQVPSFGHCTHPRCAADPPPVSRTLHLPKQKLSP